MRLILVRHGETAQNALHINQGHKDNPLNDAGKEQARKLGEHFKDTRIDVIYASDLQRAIKTAEAIAHHHNLPVITDARLREQNFGVLDGAPQGHQRELARKLGVPELEFRPEGGETVRELRLRARAFLAEILEKHKEQSVLVVSHGGTLRNIMMPLLNAAEKRAPEFSHTNTGVSVVEFSETGEPKLVMLNDTSHLS